MHHQRCVCPKCGTTLRVKDRAYYNRPVPCPDCRTLVVIVPVGDDALEAHLAEVPADETRPPQSPLAATLPRAQDWTPNVIVVSWLAAFVVAALIGGVAFWPKPQRRPVISDLPDEPEPTVPEVPQAVEVSPPVDDPPFLPVEDLIADVPQGPLIVPAPADEEPDFPPADAALVATSEISPPQPPKKVLPPIDLEAALAQPLLEFRQNKSIPRRELLDLIEELLGAPIRYDREELGAAAESLDKPISFDLQQISVGDVLAKTLEGTGLVTEREPDGLRLKPASDALKP